MSWRGWAAQATKRAVLALELEGEVEGEVELYRGEGRS
ncbi:hypothetical protein Caci_0887 [Catenulispora acidiphila DSM 44928]|uniref:Uncharacterized protein n=1 Tax=Catenulispora acidiphila (strain DSM 44928 / JCM 14897 / NBRC 102108 / NRRL B-24433 / ID139908) TaxID=479433 RepID=C7Q2H8_CATAD|nr:hypothetical protein Caci_0887 [Catenulispora acidiphila DSM 44928]